MSKTSVSNNRFGATRTGPTVLTVGTTLLVALTAGLSGFGCGGPKGPDDPAAAGPPQPRSPEELSVGEMVPYPISIGGKPAVFDPAIAKEKAVDGKAAAYIEGEVPADATVTIDYSQNKVTVVILRLSELDEGGKLVGNFFTIYFPKGTTQGKLSKVKPGTNYLLNALVFAEVPKGTKNPPAVRVRFKTAGGGNA